MQTPDWKLKLHAFWREIAAIKRPMLDSGYSMLNNLHGTFGGVDKHRESSNQYRASASDSKVLLKNLKGEVLFLVQQ